MKDNVDSMSVAYTDTSNPPYTGTYEDMGNYHSGDDLNSHTAVVVIYRIIVPIICACGILGIILTGM